jgi:hypothetical protein
MGRGLRRSFLMYRAPTQGCGGEPSQGLEWGPGLLMLEEGLG